VHDGSAPVEFIGRQQELDRLNAAFARTKPRGGATVIVGGEAGIGKSRLLAQFVEGIRPGGARVLSGDCIEFSGRGVPFAPFVEVLRTLVRSEEPGRLPALLGPGRHALATLLPELEPTAPPSTDSDSDLDRGEQARLFEALLTMLERISRSRPTVLIIEDIQWADVDTRDLLAFLLRHLRTANVLAILSLRTDELDPDAALLAFIAELEREDWVERFNLGPLDRSEVRRFVLSRLADRTTAELVDDVLSRTGGNPFYVEHLLAVLETDGVTTLPPELRDVLVARLGRLDPMVLAIVRAVAAAGSMANEAMLGEALGLSPREVTEALRAAIDDGLLAMVDLRDGSGGVAFRHALVREIAYSQLLPAERLSLHAAFGKHLLARRLEGGKADNAELAFQLDHAGQVEQAMPIYVAAGEQAERSFAFGLARRHYERLLELWNQVRPPAGEMDVDRPWVLQRAAECALLTGKHDRAVELGREALEDLERGDPVDPVRLGLFHDRYRWYLWEAGDRVPAAAAVADALRAIPSEPPSAPRARVLAHAAGLRMENGEIAASADLADPAVEMARAVGARAEEALASGILGWCQAVLGQIDLGVATLRHGLSIAIELGGPEGIALGHASLAALLDRVGRTESSLDTALDAFRIVKDLGVSRTYGGTLLGQAAKALFDLGRWSEAVDIANQGLELDPVGLAAVELHLVSARIDVNQGRNENARSHLARARSLWHARGEPTTVGPALLAGEAELSVFEDRLDDVRAAVEAGIAYLAEDRAVDPALGRLAAFGLRAEADAAGVARARHDGVAESIAIARAAAIGTIVERSSSAPATVADARRGVLVALCRAEGRRVVGSVDASEWADVATGWEAHARPFVAAYARYRFAEALLGAHGSRADAAAALRSARDATASLGATPLQAEIELLAQQARIDLVDGAIVPRETDRFGLTERESEVIRLVAAGWSNQQIADALFITRKTASVHVSNVLGKFGVRNRVEAAAIAHRLGIHGDEPPRAAP
jgi:DNA-binding CsgD family transcriptional regulator/tetratricopeptide (TPR) repeat protein